MDFATQGRFIKNEGKKTEQTETQTLRNFKIAIKPHPEFSSFH